LLSPDPKPPIPVDPATGRKGAGQASNPARAAAGKLTGLRASGMMEAIQACRRKNPLAISDTDELFNASGGDAGAVSIEEAAGFLGAPVDYVEFLLEAGRLPYREEKGLKRILLKPLQDYKRRPKGSLNDMVDFINYTEKLGV
jgi:hypothetical protein